MTIFKTTVLNIGVDAEDFKKEKMLVLFGESVPPELSDFCYNIQLAPVSQPITTGMKLSFNEADYLITAIGHVVEENLKNLGHITIHFDGANYAEMPGTIYVEKKPLPDIKIGDTISIHPA